MRVPLVRSIAFGLAEAGIATLRFNFRGVGDSMGCFDDGQGEVDDVAGAFDWLSAQPAVDPGRMALVGYSFGATMALAHAIHDDRARALVLIGLPLTWMALPPISDCRPWLLVVGERDQFCPLPDLHAFGQGLKGDAMVHAVSGADHFLFGYETEVVGVVEDFLQKVL
jgi:alpha/beta superfamily hydrolase